MYIIILTEGLLLHTIGNSSKINGLTGLFMNASLYFNYNGPSSNPITVQLWSRRDYNEKCDC